MKRQAMIVALGGLLGWGVALGLGSWGPAWTLTRDLRVPQSVPARLYHREGLANPPDLPYGLRDPQPAPDGSVWRFTDGHATVTFPYAAAAGRYSTMRVRLAGAPTAGQPPPTVTLRLNRQPVATFTAAARYAGYTATLDTHAAPSPYLHPSDVQLDISSSTVADPLTGQARGVAVAEVQLTQSRSPTEIAVEAGLWAALLTAVLALGLARRLPLRWAVGYGAATLLTFGALHWTYAPRAISLLVEIPLAGGAWLAAVGLAPARRPALGLGIAAAGLWLVVAGRVLGDWEVDDAYISYRYADNLLHGAGLVYNPGEIVEGYTNFLWTLWIAAGLALGLDPAGLALASTIAAGLSLVALTYHIGARLTGVGALWPLWSVAALAVDTGVLTYGARGSGLETLPFAVLVLLPVALLWGGAARAVRWRVVGGVALAAAALLRPEGIIVAAILLGGRAVQDGAAGRPVRRLLAGGALPFAAIWLPYQVWRIGFYGYLFPNTFYAKTGASLALLERGLVYAGAVATDHWLLTALLVAGALGGAGWGLRALRGGLRPAVQAAGHAVAEPQTGLCVTLAALVCVYTLYIVIAGGDWAEAGRFFVPILAPAVLLAAEVVRWVGNRARNIPRAGRAATLALAGLTLIYWIATLWSSRPAGAITTRLERETYKYQKWALAALWLRDHTSPNTLLAATPAGVLAYYSRRPVVDMLGLNDLHIGHLAVATLGSAMAGHDKHDPAYVLARRPVYMLDYEEWYFAADLAPLTQQYAVETVRTASGYPIRLLRRR